jgi:hypothetical protein
MLISIGPAVFMDARNKAITNGYFITTASFSLNTWNEHSGYSACILTQTGPKIQVKNEKCLAYQLTPGCASPSLHPSRAARAL